jgi:hypothetical protein
MPRNFNLSVLSIGLGSRRGARFWLLLSGALLLVANGVALFLYLFPPGGSQAELVSQRDQLRLEIRAARATTTRLHTVSGKVETGSAQAAAFEAQYFLPERVAYGTVITEIQRMAKAAGVEEREAVYSKEVIEGSDDLSLLNAGARFQGSYVNLMRFFNEADKSPLLLMLDTVQATPQQKSGQIDTEIRFQAVIYDEPGFGGVVGGQP